MRERYVAKGAILPRFNTSLPLELGGVSFLFTSFLERLSGKSKQALFWSLGSGQIGIFKLY